ncbi:MAG: glutamine--fructose-6-phosphate aminotransferase, partial [Proteobacteria bacterium]|nr:glutamine--fructose-6-phosphate aminotransferase [Pseudomonadota bacterium]
MTFLEKITVFFKENFRYPRIYFGRSIRSVPTGALILFPVQDSQLNCGLTGIVAFKTKEIAKPKIPIDKIESIPLHLKGYTYDKVKEKNRNLTNHYLGGATFVAELQDLIRNLKTTSSLYTIFKELPLQETLKQLSSELEKIINGEERKYHKTLRVLSFEENETISTRITLLKDIIWSLKQEVLKNLEKIEELSRFTDRDIPPLVFKRTRDINTLCNNLDRLEVRGRDSAGISVISILEKKDYLLFERELEKRSLLNEFFERQKQKILLNRGITINRGGNTISVIFTYKIAAQIGHLGDNGAFLRKQIRDDIIFQLLIALPSIYQTTVAHTRWASVGEISEANCHPIDNAVIQSDKGPDSHNRKGNIHVCLNGDIDNYLILKEKFENETKKSIPPQITTDTKIIPLQIQKYYDKGHPIEESFRLAVNDFKGSHAIAMHTDMAPGKIFLAQRGSGQTIFVGLGKEHYITASEVYGLVEDTSRYIKMEGEKPGNELQDKNQGQIFILDQDSYGGLSGIKAMNYDGTLIHLSEDAIKQTEITPRDIDRQDSLHYF